MLVTPPFGASSNIALWRAYSKPPVELVVADLVHAIKLKWYTFPVSYIHKSNNCIIPQKT